VAAPPEIPEDLRQDPWALPRGEDSSLVRSLSAPPEAVATTDAMGRFVFTELRPGTFRLRARPSGLAEYLSAAFAVPWEGEYPVALRRGASLSGTLSGATGEPEPHTPVSISRSGELLRRTTTDAEGKFRFENLPPGADYVLQAEDRSPAARDRDSRRAFALEEGKTVVYDLHRGPAGADPTIAGARLAPAMAHDGDAGTVAGGLAAADLRPGVHQASGPGEQASDTVRFELEITRASTGEPYRLPVEVRIDEEGGRGTWRGAADGGSFAAEDLPPGKHRLRIWTGKLLRRDTTLDLQADHEERLALEPPHEVPVRLLIAEDRPFVGEAEISLLRDGRELYRSRESIDETALLPTPGPGDYEVVVKATGYSTRFTIQVDPEGEPPR
jgi:hypothetical protein